MTFYYNSVQTECIGAVCFNPEDDIMREYECTTDTDYGKCWICTQNKKCAVASNGVSCSNNGTCYMDACAYDSSQTNDDCQDDEYCAIKAGTNQCIPSENYVCKKVEFIKRKIPVKCQNQTWYVSKNP